MVVNPNPFDPLADPFDFSNKPISFGDAMAHGERHEREGRLEDAADAYLDALRAARRFTRVERVRLIEQAGVAYTRAVMGLEP